MVKPLGGFVKLIFEMERIDPLYGTSGPRAVRNPANPSRAKSRGVDRL